MFDYTPQQALTIQLEQWPYLSLVPVECIQQALQLMGQPTDAWQKQKLAGEAFQRTGGTAIVEDRLRRSAVSVFSTSQLSSRACRSGSAMARSGLAGIEIGHVPGCFPLAPQLNPPQIVSDSGYILNGAMLSPPVTF
jgi:hypothetical protein